MSVGVAIKRILNRVKIIIINTSWIRSQKSAKTKKNEKNEMTWYQQQHSNNHLYTGLWFHRFSRVGALLCDGLYIERNSNRNINNGFKCFFFLVLYACLEQSLSTESSYQEHSSHSNNSYNSRRSSWLVVGEQFNLPLVKRSRNITAMYTGLCPRTSARWTNAFAGSRPPPGLRVRRPDRAVRQPLGPYWHG